MDVAMNENTTKEKKGSRPGLYTFMVVWIFLILAIGLTIVLLVSNLTK
jgi:hypothetical protein